MNRDCKRGQHVWVWLSPFSYNYRMCTCCQEKQVRDSLKSPWRTVPPIPLPQRTKQSITPVDLWGSYE